MKRLLILGAGGHGKVVADAAALMNIWNDIAFLDDREGSDKVTGFPIIGKFNDYESLKNRFNYAFVALGNNRTRLQWIEKLSLAKFIIPTIIHPYSFVSKFSNIGNGSIVMAGAIVNAYAKIGKGCILNTSCSIDHDCIIEDGVHVSPGVHIGGTTKVGFNTWLCIGSSIVNNVTIGSNVIVASGATVIHDIQDNVMVAGVPAVIKKRFDDI